MVRGLNSSTWHTHDLATSTSHRLHHIHMRAVFWALRFWRQTCNRSVGEL